MRSPYCNSARARRRSLRRHGNFLGVANADFAGHELGEEKITGGG
jgi:hypothetical protein